MTTLIPRKPYTDEELTKLYPPNLELQLVQILMRHGERTPVNARFENTGLPAYWPYCSSVRKLISPILNPSSDNNQLTTLEWTRRLETFSNKSDAPVLATGGFPSGPDNICDMGTLTDLGRTTTHNLGLRLRDLYINRLGFIPPAITPSSGNSSPFSTTFYLRTTPVPRALESLQQTFSALYPPHTRDPSSPPPTIITRVHADETLYPNDGNCRRFAELSRLFAQRAADKWNASKEMDYLNSLYGKYMPDGPAGSRVAVDSRPRLSGIMDTINATLAHGPETKLPDAFYDENGREITEKIGVEEWFGGYNESREYRMLGIGGLLGDLVGRMVGSVEGASKVKFGLHGCHDTTIAGVLMGLGAYGTERWPPFTSHIAIEMFRDASGDEEGKKKKKGWWSSLVGSAGSVGGGGEIGRRPTEELSESEKKRLEGYYVRLRYNDELVTIPGCKNPGNHLEGDESFCTLAAFKEIVDKFTPTNWKQQCRMNKGQPSTPTGKPEWAGY